MIKRTFFSIFLLTLFNFFPLFNQELMASLNQERKEFDSFLEKIYQNLLNRTKKQIEHASRVVKEKKDLCTAKNVFLCIDGKKYFRKNFEDQYQLFKEITKINISEKQFLEKYIQNIIFLDKANQKGYNKNKVNFFVRYTLIEYYSKKYLDQKITPINKTDVVNFFYKELANLKNYKIYSLKKNYDQIQEIYKQKKLIEQQNLFFSFLRNQYQIFQNDEWKDNLIQKFIQKKYHKNEENKYIYSIKYNNQKKWNISISMVEEALKWILEKSNNNKFAQKKYRQEFLNQILFQNLVYLHMLENGILNQNFYKKYKNFLEQQIIIDTYIKKDLLLKEFYNFIEKKYIFLYS